MEPRHATDTSFRPVDTISPPDEHAVSFYSFQFIISNNRPACIIYPHNKKRLWSPEISHKICPEMTVQQIIDKITAALNTPKDNQTVDTIKIGRADMEVTGIAVTTSLSIDGISEAIGLGANFIITHEPTFYSHLDDTEGISANTVFQQKLKLLEENEIALWRCHDAPHRCQPDMICEGIVRKLEWDQFADDEDRSLLHIPAARTHEVISHIKRQLRIETVRVIGSTDHTCRTVAILPGAWGGARQIATAERTGADMLICGEVAEWESPEYFRDGMQLGRKQALVILGHWNSEQPGMQYVAEWLGRLLPEETVTYLNVVDQMQYM